jgi:hypothetical protein
VEGEVAEEEGEEDKKIKTVLKLHLNVVDSILAELFRFIWKNNITTTNELITLFALFKMSVLCIASCLQ